MPTVTLTATADTYLKDGTDTICGSRATVVIGKSRIEHKFYHTLLRFDASAIPVGTLLESAVLTMRYVRGEPVGGVNLEIGRTCVRQEVDDWSEAQSNWRWYNRSSQKGWFIAGASAWDHVTNPLFSPDNADLVVDIRDLVQDAIDLRDGDVDIFIRYRDEVTVNGNALFASREHGTLDPPRLTLVYEPTIFTLTVTDDGNGTVALDPETPQNTYPEGTVVTLTVTPDTYYAFDAWAGADAGDVTGTGTVADPYRITMDADKTIQATFAKATYTLTETEGANGSILVSKLGAEGGVTDNGDGTYTIDAGTSISIQISPDAGFQIDAVSSSTGLLEQTGAHVGPVTSYTKTWHVLPTSAMFQDEEITASFKAMHTLTLTEVNGADGVLEVSAIWEISWSEAEYPLFTETKSPQNTVGVFTVQPDPGYQALVEGDTATPFPWGEQGDATVWHVNKPDADLTITVTFTAIAVEQETDEGWFEYPLRTKPFTEEFNN